MKKAILSIVLLVILQANLFSQFDHSCLPNGITFYNQQQINNFPSNYPNCTKIEGDLTIRGGIRLDSLQVLNSLGGSLSILYNNTLANLSGLENISSLGGSLTISSNEILADISGVKNIDATSITSLKISNNPSLSSCELENLCNYLNNPGGPVIIFTNAVGCNKPAAVASACGNTLACLPFGHYYLLSQDDIDNFKEDYLECTALEGDLIIHGVDITDLSELNQLTSVSGTLGLWFNDSLSSLSGLETLEHIGDQLSIIYCHQLINLTGLNNLSTLDGTLNIDGNRHLTSLEGLEKLHAIGDYFQLYGNRDLVNLSGLDSLASIGLDMVVGSWEDYGNKSLLNFSGLDNLTTIGGRLSVEYNESLVDFTGLSKLTSIGGNLVIKNNFTLNDLEGLNNIDANSISNLSINSNHALSNCAVHSICDYLASPSGQIHISTNSAGCNTKEEVENACLVGVDNNRLQAELSIHPNPLATSTTISYNLQQPTTVQITIFNHLGKQVEVIRQKQSHGKQQVIWNAERFPSGMYYFTLKAGEQMASGKMVVVR